MNESKPHRHDLLLKHWREVAEAADVHEGNRMTADKAEFVLRLLAETPLPVSRFLAAVLSVSPTQFYYYLHTQPDYRERFNAAMAARRQRGMEAVVRAAQRTAIQMAAGYTATETDEIIVSVKNSEGEWVESRKEIRTRQRHIQADMKFIMRILDRHAAELMAQEGGADTGDYEINVKFHAIDETDPYGGIIPPASGAVGFTLPAGAADDDEPSAADAEAMGKD